MARISAAGFVVLILILALLGRLVGWHDLQSSSIATFLLVGSGVGPCLHTRAKPAAFFLVFSVAVSVSSMIAVGLVMAELKFWHPSAAFALAVTTTLVLLASALRRDIPGLLTEGAGWRRAGDVGWSRFLLNLGTLAGLVLVVGASLRHQSVPKPAGLYAQLGPVWYLGLITLALCLFWAMRSGANPAWIVASLSCAAVLSQALSYGAPTVSSAARHVGVVDYIRVHHAVAPRLDIYQAWSGLFAGAAWICDAAGIRDPMVFATWWPVLISAALALAVTMLASRWVAPGFAAWAAGLVFALSNTLNITYFSPQSVGIFLAVVLYSIALGTDKLPPAERLVASGAGGRPAVAAVADARTAGSHQLPDPTRPPAPRGGIERPGPGRIAVICFLACAMTVSHQISPYLTAVGLAIFVAFRLLRPWWLTLVVLTPALIWAFVNRGVLKGFISLGAVGRFWDNAQPPTHAETPLAPASITRLAFDVPVVVLLLVGVGAVLTLLRRRTREHWALILAAASPAILFAGTDYGQEGVFRVTLFALPWLAVLVAAGGWTLPRFRAAAVSVGVAILLAVNVFGQTALDWARVVRPDAVAAIRDFESPDNDGAAILLTGTGNATPSKVTSQYLSVIYSVRMSPPDVTGKYDATKDVDRMTWDFVTQTSATHYYALVSDSIGAYDDRYGYQPYADYLKLGAAMAVAPMWRVVRAGTTTTLYELTDRAAYIKSGRGAP